VWFSRQRVVPKDLGESVLVVDVGDPTAESALEDHWPRKFGIRRLCGVRSHVRLFPGKARQGARANVHIGHASCYLRSSEMKQRTENRIEARVVPAVAVAHL
jgi:hypothetical protein